MIGLALFMAITWTGCTKKFEERNTSPTGLSTLDPNDLKSLFPTHCMDDGVWAMTKYNSTC